MGVEVGIQFSRPLWLCMVVVVPFPTQFASRADLRYWILISAAVRVLSKDNPRDADNVATIRNGYRAKSIRCESRINPKCARSRLSSSSSAAAAARPGSTKKSEAHCYAIMLSVFSLLFLCAFLYPYPSFQLVQVGWVLTAVGLTARAGRLLE